MTCTGDPGHGSRFIENTAVEKLVSLTSPWLCGDYLTLYWQEKVLRSALAHREEQKTK